MTNVPTVVCVLHSGGDFLPEHVWALYDDVRQQWPHDRELSFVCLTDVTLYATVPAERGRVQEIALKCNYSGWWSKMEMFRPDLDRLGDMLFFDLDTVVIDSLRDIATCGQLTTLSDFYTPKNLASGLMYIPEGDRAEVWAAWMQDTGKHMRMRGDQNFLRTLWKDRALRWQTVLPGQVVSFKGHVRKLGGVPEDARVVCYHGRPRPWAEGGALPVQNPARSTLLRVPQAGRKKKKR